MPRPRTILLRTTAGLTLLGALVTTACDSQPEAPLAQATSPATDEAPAPRAPVDDDRYDMVYPTEVIEAGVAQELALIVTPASGLKINKEYPWKLQLDAPADATLGAATIGKDAIKLEDARATIPVSLTAARPGEVALTGKASFSVCNDDRCEILRDQPVAFTVTAAPAAAAEPAADPQAAPEAAADTAD